MLIYDTYTAKEKGYIKDYPKLIQFSTQEELKPLIEALKGRLELFKRISLMGYERFYVELHSENYFNRTSDYIGYSAIGTSAEREGVLIYEFHFIEALGSFTNNAFIQFHFDQEGKMSYKIGDGLKDHSLEDTVSFYLVRTLHFLVSFFNKQVVAASFKTPNHKIRSEEGRENFKADFVVVSTKKYQNNVSTRLGKTLDWNFSFPVRGHWRKIKGYGKDMNGELRLGKTWVSQHIRGEGPMDKRVRIVQ